IETSADRLWLVANGTVKPFDGDMDDYTAQVLGQRGGQPGQSRGQRPAAPMKSRRSPGAVHKQIQEIESKMLKLKEKIEVMDRALADSELYAREPKKAADFSRLRGRLASELDQAE